MAKKKKQHHRSDFFLGTMEEVYQQKKTTRTPTPSPVDTRELKETKKEKEERESGLLPVWEAPRRSHKPHKRKKKDRPEFLPFFTEKKKSNKTKQSEPSSFKKKEKAEKPLDPNAPRIIPTVHLKDNPEAIPGFKKSEENRKKVTPKLKGMENPEAMPGSEKKAKVKPAEEQQPEEIKAKKEKENTKTINPFDSEELSQIFKKEEGEEEKDFLEQSEEALQKAFTKGKDWLREQAKDTDGKNESAAANITKSLSKKAAKYAKEKFVPFQEKILKKAEELKAKKAKKEAPILSEEKPKEPVLSAKQLEQQQKVRESLDGMYDVYKDQKKQEGRKFSRQDMIRYAVLFVCIFGFVSAGAYVFTKLYDYYRSYVIYSGLQELVEQEDFFQEEYLKKTPLSVISKTPLGVLNGEENESESENGTFTDQQQNLVNKIGQLKKINPDTVGWIKINGTVVNYPMVWSSLKNYYLHRDFYGKNLSGGTIYMDERNDSVITKNRNAVIYGHNMNDGSMFASVHDFASSSTFYNAIIEITTEEGVFIYTPFSVHESDAYDNYFETDFASDEDFINFCEQMKFISLYETDFEFDADSKIITLSTCGKDEREKNDRFAVHAVLTKVIR